MKQIILIFLWLFWSITQIYAQNSIQFNKVYWADTMNILSSTVLPIQDGYIVAGGYSHVNKFIYIRKIDLWGETEWFKVLDSGLDVGATPESDNIIKTSDGHFLLVYSKYESVGSTDRDIQMVKFDEFGEIIFQKEFDNPYNTIAVQTLETNDLGFIMVGATHSGANTDTTRYYLQKTDSLGNFEWEQTYLLESSSVAFSVQQTWDLGYIISGFGFSYETNHDIYVVRTNHLGEVIWERNYGGPDSDCAGRLVRLDAFSYLITSCQEVDGIDKMYHLKIDDNGEVLWERVYNEFAEYTALQTTAVIKPDFGYIGAAFTFNELGNPSNIIMDFDANGNINWQKEITIDPHQEVYLKDIEATADGGYVLAGYQFWEAPQKGWILKIDGEGNTCEPADCDTIIVQDVVPSVPILAQNNPYHIHLSPNPASEVVTVYYELPMEFPFGDFALI